MRAVPLRISDSTPGAILQPQPPPCDSEVRRGSAAGCDGACVHGGSWSSCSSWSKAARSACGSNSGARKRTLCAQRVQQARRGVFACLAGAAALQQGGQRRGVAGREVALVVGAQHADVAGDARGQHRRAAAHRLHDHVGAAFHAAGVHQHVGALDAPARGRVRQRAEPAVAGQSPCGRARELAQRRRRARRRCGRCGCRRPRSRRAASNSVCGDFTSRRWPTITARRRATVLGSVRRARAWTGTPRAPCRAAPAAGPAAPSSCSTTRRCASSSERCACGVAVDVAVQVGAGQHHDQPAARVRRAPRRRSRRPSAARAAPSSASSRRGQRRPASAARCAHANARRQQLRPAPRGLPVAVVGVGQRRAYDDDRWIATSPGLYRARRRRGAGAPRGAAAAVRAALRAQRAAHTRLADAFARRVGRCPSGRAATRPSSTRRCGSWATSAGSRSAGSPATASAARGVACDPDHARGPSLLPQADACTTPAGCAHRTPLGAAAARCGRHARLPGAHAGADAGAAGRAAAGCRRRRAVLLPPGRCCTRTCSRGRALHGAGPGRSRCALARPLPRPAADAELELPAQRFRLGPTPAGFAFDNELRGARQCASRRCASTRRP